MTAPSLDELLSGPETIVVPGAYDALSARIAVRAGARAVYMSGFGIAGASFGVPDIGLLGPDQMSDRVRAIASAVAPVPLLADGDTGYGGPANVARLVHDYERAGAAAIQIEDQVSPKRCGHMEGKEIVPLAEAAMRIRAAAEARSGATFKIIARTDAIATDGIDEAMRRGDAFLAAGADLLFIEAPSSEADMEAIGRRFRAVPLVANLVEDGKTPMLSVSRLREMGFRIVLRPIAALLATVSRLESVYGAILAGHPDIGERTTFARYNEIVGLPEALTFSERFAEK